MSPGPAHCVGSSVVLPQWPLSAAMPPLAALPSAAGCAREWVAALLREWALTGLADTARLVVSEVVANAVNATARSGTATGLICIRLLADRTRVIIDVADHAPGVPRLREAGDFEESGRGLALVDALCASWGWRPACGQAGKAVWAELTIPS